MNIHKNARLTPQGRLLLVERITEHGWSVAQAAQAAGLSTRQAYRWCARYRSGGRAALEDRSSAPGHCPRRTSAAQTTAIEQLRRQRLTGPGIARQLGMPASTVGKVLRRLGLGRLRALDPKPPPMRYERERPGELIHLDSKKLGRIEGIGHRITGRQPGAINRHHGIGWEALHICIDDASRLAYSEILPDEKKESAIGFLGRALAWLAGQGVTVERVMTDNGSAYRSKAFRAAVAAAGVKHKRTRPYTPRTNGKAEIHPNQPARVGLRPSLCQLAATPLCPGALARALQYGAATCRLGTTSACDPAPIPVAWFDRKDRCFVPTGLP
jgi:transposase-like protein